MAGARFTTTAHATAEATDKVPSLKGTTKGYNTPLTLATYAVSAKAATAAQARATSSTTTVITPQNLADIGILKGLLFGLTLSNGTDATNDIDIAAGSCSDSTGVRILVVSALTKQLDATWAAGTNAGGRMSAAGIANTTYHVFAILKDSDGSVDYGFDVSATAPTMPSGYTYFRRIGSIIRASNAIVLFNQVGDEFLRLVPSQDAASASWTSTSTLVTCGVPVGVKVGALVSVYVSLNTTLFGLVTSPDQTDTAAASSNFNLAVTANSRICIFSDAVRTDTSGQIRVNTDVSTAGGGFMHTRGWIDTRGRLA